MKRVFIIVFALLSTSIVRADEGMWLLSLLGKNIEQMQAQGCKLTAEDIYQELIGQGQGINFSTVYRILEMFTAKELTEKHYLPDSRKYGFSLRAMGHRHRLICLKCRRIVEIDHCPLAGFEAELAEKTQFDIVGHNLEWYGYCPECRGLAAGGGEKTMKPAKEE